jgi:hypothetical protein
MEPERGIKLWFAVWIAPRKIIRGFLDSPASEKTTNQSLLWQGS